MPFDDMADIRSHLAHLEEANGCLQQRLSALEATLGQVLTLAAAVDSSGRETVAGALARLARAEEVRTSGKGPNGLLETRQASVWVEAGGESGSGTGGNVGRLTGIQGGDHAE